MLFEMLMSNRYRFDFVSIRYLFALIVLFQSALENIAFCNLREEDLRFITDQHVVKLFRAAQMIIEYLLYAQDQLSNSVTNLSRKYGEKKRYNKHSTANYRANEPPEI